MTKISRSHYYLATWLALAFACLYLIAMTLPSRDGKDGIGLGAAGHCRPSREERVMPLDTVRATP